MKKIMLLTLTLLFTMIGLVACDDDNDSQSDKETVAYSSAIINGVPSMQQSSYSWSSYFDNIISLTIYSDYRMNMDEIFNQIDDYIKTYGQLLNDEYDFTNVENIHSINENPTKTHTIDKELYDFIAYSLTKQTESFLVTKPAADNSGNSSEITISIEDYFNIALGPITKLWEKANDDCKFDVQTQTGYGTCVAPSDDDLNERSSLLNTNNIVLDAENSTITLTNALSSLDVSKIANGYISKIITDYLDQQNIEGYVIEFGLSQVTSSGVNPYDSYGNFEYFLQDPEEGMLLTFTTEPYVTLNLPNDYTVVSSSQFQEYYKVNDEIYHDIISPTTLHPVSNSMQFTIFSKDDFLADLYADAIYLMSVEDGLAFVNSLENTEGIWYIADGNYVTSDGFDELVDYEIVTDND